MNNQLCVKWNAWFRSVGNWLWYRERFTLQFFLIMRSFTSCCHILPYGVLSCVSLKSKRLANSSSEVFLLAFLGESEVWKLGISMRLAFFRSCCRNERHRVQKSRDFSTSQQPFCKHSSIYQQRLCRYFPSCRGVEWVISGSWNWLSVRDEFSLLFFWLLWNSFLFL